jgi:hypothetical protein
MSFKSRIMLQSDGGEGMVSPGHRVEEIVPGLVLQT